MDKQQMRKDLAKEAVKLIKEFRKLNEILGDNIFTRVRANRSGSKIIIEHMYHGKLEYDLEEVSTVLEDEIEGFAPCGSVFYDTFDLAVDELDYEYKKKSKKEFMDYVGKLYFMKFRCEEIYNRLKEIDGEAENILD